MYNVTCEFGREHKKGVWKHLQRCLVTERDLHDEVRHMVFGIDDEVSETICILWEYVLGSLHKDPLECVLPYRPGCIPIFSRFKIFYWSFLPGNENFKKQEFLNFSNCQEHSNEDYWKTYVHVGCNLGVGTKKVFQSIYRGVVAEAILRKKSQVYGICGIGEEVSEITSILGAYV